MVKVAYTFLQCNEQLGAIMPLIHVKTVQRQSKTKTNYNLRYYTRSSIPGTAVPYPQWQF